MKLLFMLPLLLIGASLLVVETEANWFKKIGRKIKHAFTPPMFRKRMYSNRGHINHKASGLFLTLDPDRSHFHLQSKISPRSYMILYERSDRVYIPDKKSCLYNYRHMVWPMTCTKPWRKVHLDESHSNFIWKSNDHGAFQFKNKETGECIHPREKQVKPGTSLQFTFDCGPKSYIWNYADYQYYSEEDPEGRKRRSHSHHYSKRQASSHGHFKTSASSHDHDERSGSA